MYFKGMIWGNDDITLCRDRRPRLSERMRFFSPFGGVYSFGLADSRGRLSLHGQTPTFWFAFLRKDFLRLPCVKGAVAERLRDCVSMKYSFTIPPSFSCENATSLYTREAIVKKCLLPYQGSLREGAPDGVGWGRVRSQADTAEQASRNLPPSRFACHLPLGGRLI